MFDVSINNDEHAFIANGLFCSNSHKSVVLRADTMNWVDLQKTNRDMEFSKWQEYLIRVACAMYRIDPAEIGFPMNGSSSSQSMFGENVAHKLEYSKESGLRPLLTFHQAHINKYVIEPRNKDFELVFVGIDAETEEKEIELALKEMSYKGLNETRIKRGLTEKLAKDDIVLNPTNLQYLQMQQQAKQKV